MDELLSYISKLSLELIPGDWVKLVTDNDFVSDDGFPTEYELEIQDLDVSAILTACSQVISQWLIRCGDQNETSWKSLKSKVDVERLLSVLGNFLPKDTQELESAEAAQAALVAAKTYYYFLAIPQAAMYDVFHPFLFERSLKVFSLSQKFKKADSKKKKKGRKRTDDDEEDEGESEVAWSREDMEDVLKELCKATEGLVKALSSVDVVDENQTASKVLKVLVRLTKCDVKAKASHAGPAKSSSLEKLSWLAYQAIEAMLKATHPESLEEAFRLLVRLVFQELIVQDESRVLIDMFVSYKESVIHWFTKLLDKFGVTCQRGLLALAQQLCVRAPERADPRARVVSLVAELVSIFPLNLYYEFIEWAVGFSHGDEAKSRLFGVELIVIIIGYPDRLGDERQSLQSRASSATNEERRNSNDEPRESNEERRESNEERRESNVESVAGDAPRSTMDQSNIFIGTAIWDHSYLLAALLSLTRDRAPSVRSKALSSFGNLITSPQISLRTIMDEIFTHPYIQHIPDDLDPKEPTFLDLAEFLSEESHTRTNPLPGGTVIMNLIELLCNDEKVFVRKAALQAITNVCLLHNFWIRPRRLRILVGLAQDESVSIRKMVVQCLSELLLRYPQLTELQHAWVEAVVPLMGDSDSKTEEKVLEAMERLILDNIYPFDMDPTEHSGLPWSLIQTIVNRERLNFFQAAFHSWNVKGKFDKGFVKVVRSFVGTEYNTSCWLILHSISRVTFLPDPRFVACYYLDHVHSSNEANYTSQLVLECLFYNLTKMEKPLQLELYTNISEKLELFQVPLMLISKSFDLCYAYDSEAWMQYCSNKLVAECGRVVSGWAKSSKRGEICPRRVQAAIFTVGEAVQLAPDALAPTTLDLLVSLVDDDRVYAKYSQPPSQTNGQLDVITQAVLITTLNKLCILFPQVASAAVPIFGSFLASSSSPNIIINALVALCDLCTKNALVADMYLGQMAMCMKHKDVKVRRRVVQLITNLLQEDYLKLKAPLFYYMLMMTQDPDSIVRDTTLSYWIYSVFKKNPGIPSRHLVSSIFYFNNLKCSADEGPNSHCFHPGERETFTLSGVENKDKRRELYTLVLKNLLDYHRFSLVYRLCNEILDGVAEDKIPLEGAGLEVLDDALYLLACDEIRIQQIQRSQSVQENDDGELDDAAGAVASTHLVSGVFKQLLKKGYVERFIPIILKLKRKLEIARSPLLKTLLISLSHLMKDFKDQVNEIFAADEELAAEVELVMKKMEEEERKELGDEDDDDEALTAQPELMNRIREIRENVARVSMGLEGALQGITVEELLGINEASQGPSVNEQSETPTEGEQESEKENSEQPSDTPSPSPRSSTKSPHLSIKQENIPRSSSSKSSSSKRSKRSRGSPTDDNLENTPTVHKSKRTRSSKQPSK